MDFFLQFFFCFCYQHIKIAWTHWTKLMCWLVGSVDGCEHDHHHCHAHTFLPPHTLERRVSVHVSAFKIFLYSTLSNKASTDWFDVLPFTYKWKSQAKFRCQTRKRRRHTHIHARIAIKRERERTRENKRKSLEMEIKTPDRTYTSLYCMNAIHDYGRMFK